MPVNFSRRGEPRIIAFAQETEAERQARENRERVESLKQKPMPKTDKSSHQIGRQTEEASGKKVKREPPKIDTSDPNER